MPKPAGPSQSAIALPVVRRSFRSALPPANRCMWCSASPPLPPRRPWLRRCRSCWAGSMARDASRSSPIAVLRPAPFSRRSPRSATMPIRGLNISPALPPIRAVLPRRGADTVGRLWLDLGSVHETGAGQRQWRGRRQRLARAVPAGYRGRDACRAQCHRGAGGRSVDQPADRRCPAGNEGAWRQADHLDRAADLLRRRAAATRRADRCGDIIGSAT